MFKNYFNIAIAVLRRRKFFTFISLFGISFTLAILMVLTSFKDSLLSANYPETNRDRSLYLNRVIQRKTKGDFNMRNSEPSYSFLEKYVTILKTPEKIAISSLSRPASIYQKDKKLDLHVKYSNQEFWEVMHFDFVEGKPYTQQQIINSERVAVISEEARNQYFGNNGLVTGKYIEIDNEDYRITGVVKNVPATMMYSYADLFLPYTAPKSNFRSKSYEGDYTAVLLAKSKDDLKKIQSEYQQVVSKIKPEDPKNYDELNSYADPYTESFTRIVFGSQNDAGIFYFYLILGIFLFLFMLLPTINLVNINISRIMERSSEIGVRKAFGASSGKLVIQFIFENIILTTIGGIIGVIIAVIVISLINQSNIIPNSALSMNIAVLTYSFLLCIAFGFLSGVVPAWRMSRMQVINALKLTA